MFGELAHYVRGTIILREAGRGVLRIPVWIRTFSMHDFGYIFLLRCHVILPESISSVEYGDE